MHYGAMLVGQFIKAAEFGTGETPAQPTWTIKNVVLEKLESISMNDTEASAGKLKTKGVIYFAEVERGWVTNRTNLECLAAMFGNETNDWIDKRVTLFAADVRVGPKMDIGIRLKGSPDIDKEITVQVKLPRRKPIPMKLIPTGKPKAISAARIVDLTAEGFAAARIGDNEAERNQSLADWWKGLTAAEKGAMKPILDDELKPLAIKGPKPATDPAES